MALVKSHTLDTGITLPEAYFRVSQVEFNLRMGIGTDTEPAKKVSVEVEAFADKASRDLGMEPFCSWRYFINQTDFPTYFDYALQDAAGCNMVSLSYDYLKTLAEYSGAVQA
jgi:hypothetical protein